MSQGIEDDYLNERTVEESAFLNILDQIHIGRILYLDGTLVIFGSAHFYNYRAAKLNIYY